MVVVQFLTYIVYFTFHLVNLAVAVVSLAVAVVNLAAVYSTRARETGPRPKAEQAMRLSTHPTVWDTFMYLRHTKYTVYG